jgi:hypothetical protein
LSRHGAPRHPLQAFATAARGAGGAAGRAPRRRARPRGRGLPLPDPGPPQDDAPFASTCSPVCPANPACVHRPGGGEASRRHAFRAPTGPAPAPPAGQAPPTFLPAATAHRTPPPPPQDAPRHTPHHPTYLAPRGGRARPPRGTPPRGPHPQGGGTVCYGMKQCSAPAPGAAARRRSQQTPPHGGPTDIAPDAHALRSTPHAPTPPARGGKGRDTLLAPHCLFPRARRWQAAPAAGPRPARGGAATATHTPSLLNTPTAAARARAAAAAPARARRPITSPAHLERARGRGPRTPGAARSPFCVRLPGRRPTPRRPRSSPPSLVLPPAPRRTPARAAPPGSGRPAAPRCACRRAGRGGARLLYFPLLSRQRHALRVPWVACDVNAFVEKVKLYNSRGFRGGRGEAPRADARGRQAAPRRRRLGGPRAAEGSRAGRQQLGGREGRAAGCVTRAARPRARPGAA